MELFSTPILGPATFRFSRYVQCDINTTINLVRLDRGVSAINAWCYWGTHFICRQCFRWKSWWYSILTVCREGWCVAVTEQFETEWTYCLSHDSFCLEVKQIALDLRWLSIHHMEGEAFFPSERLLVWASCKQQKHFWFHRQDFRRHLVFSPSLEICYLISTNQKQHLQRQENQSHITS